MATRKPTKRGGSLRDTIRYVASTATTESIRPALYLAELETAHFTFQALDASPGLAHVALQKVWEAHRAQYAQGGIEVVPFHAVADDVQIHELKVGAGYRDHEEVRS